MEISLAEQRALVLREQLSLDQAEGRAWSRKHEAFGHLERLARFLQKPKDEDFAQLYKEQRYQPFWHIACRARYVYERQRQYDLVAGGPEVEAITVAGQRVEVSGGHFKLPATEHCLEEPAEELFIDGYSNQPEPGLASYVNYPANEIPVADLDDFRPEGAIIVPPQAKASALVREALVRLIKSVQADRILEDELAVERVDLYFRPVYAFRYRWHSRDKETVVEIDGVTGEMGGNGRTFQQYVGKLVDPEFLLDVGTDTVDLLVPGGGIAIKLARKGIEVARKRRS